MATVVLDPHEWVPWTLLRAHLGRAPYVYEVDPWIQEMKSLYTEETGLLPDGTGWDSEACYLNKEFVPTEFVKWLKERIENGN